MYLLIAIFVNSSFLQLRTEVNVCKSFFFPRQYVFLVCWNFVSNLFCFQKFVCSSWFEVCVELMFSFEFVWFTNNTNPFHLHAVGPYVCGYSVLMNNIVHSFSTTHPSLNPSPPHLSFFFYLHWPPNAFPFKFSLVFPLPPPGGGDSSVVRAPDSWLKGRGFESLLERRENFLLQGRLSVLTLISVSVPPPCYRSST